MNSLFVAWRPPSPGAGWRPIGRLEFDGQLYRFWYTHGANKEPFEPLRGMEDLERIYESEELFPLFENRLLPKSRPEYEAFLHWSGLDAGIPPEPLVVLGISEGLRQTDVVEVFPCPVPDATGRYLNRFFLHGIRWLPQALDRIGTLQNGEILKLMLDWQNSHDPQAVAVRTDHDRILIGYVPRYLANDAWQLVQHGDSSSMELFVDRVNPDAPLQNRVLCRMHATWPDGFQPCCGDDFKPIPAGIAAHCALP